ncbi:MAG TPA: hypothetical protein VG099_03755, partial [Gemmataceae bacterium]|nr:hypothetical protein [Gemmataceae bacterium]
MPKIDPRAHELGDALERLQKRFGHFELQASFGDIVILVAQVQLALRHPGNQSHCSREARRIVTDIIESIEKHEPRAGELLRQGFDARFDE